MYSNNEGKLHRRVRVDFSRTGWQQFGRLNRKRGARFIRAYVLKHELSDYLAAHEASGVPLDTECQEVCYENGIYLLLHKSHGIWYITDVFAAEETAAFEPLFSWQRIRQGLSYQVARLLVGWRRLIRKAASGT